jgi:glycosyltransferase involved in cell wall biosynthesis
MKIIIISSIAPPEPLTAGRINWDLANHLSGENNLIWLISPRPSRPLGTHYATTNSNVMNRVTNNFFHITLNSFTYPDYNLFFRAYESANFGIRSINYINRNIKDYDLIYSSTWPFFCQLMIVVLRKNKRAPIVMNVQDLYPESFFAKIKSKILSKLFFPLYYVDRFIANKATHITVISESLRQVYIKNRKICESKISVIHNWQDHEEFRSFNASKEEIINKYNIKDADGKFIFMFLGNIGPVAGVETIIYSFAKLNAKNLFLIIAGSGSDKCRCQLLAEKLRIKNLVFLCVPAGLRPVVELQSISDVLLLPINPEASNSSIPSKLISYMFSGKPIITSATSISETAIAVRDSGCGWITNTNDSSDWSDIMEKACETDSEDLHTMGESGCNYALKHYSKQEALNKLSNLIYNLCIQ